MKTLTIEEALKKVIKDDISSRFDLDEYKAVPYQDKSYNDNFPKFCTHQFNSWRKELQDILIDSGYIDRGVIDKSTIFVTIKDEEFDVQVQQEKTPNIYGTFYTKIVTTPKVNGVLKRKSKAYPKGVILTKEALSESASFAQYKEELKLNKKLLDQLDVAKFLSDLSETDFVKESLLDAIELEKEYNKLSSEEAKISFLESYSFTGLGNFSYKDTASPDGFGHQNVSCRSINFKTREVQILRGNSSD